MNIFERIKNFATSYIAPKHGIDIKEASGGSSGGQITQANINNFVVKAVGNVEDDLTQDFNSPDSSLYEIQQAIRSDSYIKLAVDKYSQLIFKAGYHIVSDNDQAAEYIQSRFSMMSFMTSTPMDVLFQQVADDLVAYSNAFLIKSRVEMTNIGGIQAKGVFDTKPVGGYFRVDPSTMQIKVDKTGTIKNYQQEVGNTTKKYKPIDVIHFFIDKKGGALFGTPRIEAALEDVEMLRKIEGNVLKLVYRYSAPLMQMKIGIPEAGLMATDKEIKEARQEIEKLADDGIFITNERTEFNAIGAEGQALDASKYLKYFESRVFSALSLSNAMVGRGGAKQDADSMEEQVHDSVKFYQRAIRTFIEDKIINELLLEGGYNPIANIQDKVKFQFEEINLETKVKMETHAMNMFQGNAIPFDEMRTRLGLRSDTVDEGQLFANMIKQKNALELVNAKLSGSSGTDGNVTANVGSSGPDKQNKTSQAAKNTITPENQHGKSSVKIKESLDTGTKGPKPKDKDFPEKKDKTSKNISEYKKKFSEVYKKYNTMRNDICRNGAKAYLVLPLGRDSIGKSLTKYMASQAANGYEQALRDAGKKLVGTPKIDSSLLISRTEKHLTEMFKDIQGRLKDAKSRKERTAAFDSSEYRLRFLADHVASKAYWFAYVKAAQAMKIAQVYVDFSEGSDDSEKHSRVIHTSHFSLDDIPAYHPYCRCRLEMKAGEK